MLRVRGGASLRGGVVCGRVTAEEGHDPIGCEALANQVPIQAPELTGIGDPVAAAQPPEERRLQQRLDVLALEGLVERATGHGRRDAGRLELPADPAAAVAVYRDCGACNGAGGAGVVEAAVGLEACHGGVDRRGVVAAACQALPHLRRGELPAGEQREAVEVCLIGQIG